MRDRVDLCPSCGAAWLTSTQYQRAGCANAACELRMRLPHCPADGDNWMPAGWCGGCEHCRNYPAPTICVACTYEPGRPLMSAVFPGAPPDLPEEPVLWKNCPQNPHARARRAVEEAQEEAKRTGQPVVLTPQQVGVDIGVKDGVITFANGDTISFSGGSITISEV